jgi:hypothetical protein
MPSSVKKALNFMVLCSATATVAAAAAAAVVFSVCGGGVARI